MALYNTYRPQDFDSVVGQDHIIPILKQADKDRSFSHAYLLVGPRGTGKTTSARLIANALGSQSLDLIEIDAASHTGVDEIRDLIEKSQFTPSMSPVKTYIIDEVHMLSKQAFNALLKTLEEPPAHAYFILATTEVQKVPITIISRCQRFDFHRIEKKVIIDRLKYIAEQEGIETELEALIHIAKNADGGMRDAINIFEQVTFDKKITQEKVEESLGLVRGSVIEDFIELLIQKKTYEAIKLIEDLYAQGVNIAQFVKEILVCIRHTVLENVSPDTFQDERNKQLLTISQAFFDINFRNSSYPLFEFQLLIYSITLGQQTHIIPTEASITQKVAITDPVVVPKIANPIVKTEPAKEYVSQKKDVPMVGTPTVAGVKEKMKNIVQGITDSKIKSAFKMVHIEDIKNDTITFSIHSQFHFDTLKDPKVIAVIEESLLKELGSKVFANIILKKIDVQQKKANENIIDDALKIFGA